MNHKASPIGRIAMWVIGALGVLFTLLIYTGSDFGINAGLWISYIAFGVAALASLGFALIGIDKKSLIGIGGVLAITVIAYFVSDGATRPEWNISEGTSKWIGAGLILTYLAMLGAVGAILVGEVRRMLK
ncbi:MAG: hypothetical protein JNM49_00145 [Flavobacteriales bacterium]|jgi:hypothetical protein|nr:hypothetical protein [Flavobacteriales bacterium]